MNDTKSFLEDNNIHFKYLIGKRKVKSNMTNMTY